MCSKSPLCQTSASHQARLQIEGQRDIEGCPSANSHLNGPRTRFVRSVRKPSVFPASILRLARVRTDADWQFELVCITDSQRLWPRQFGSLPLHVKSRSRYLRTIKPVERG